MTETQNLHLPQWEAEDRIMRTDFNTAMASIDAHCGSCEVVSGTYTGTGDYSSSGPSTLTFSAKPIAVFITAKNSGTELPWLVMLRSANYGSLYLGQSEYVRTTWSDNSVSWYSVSSAAKQGNKSNVGYAYVALLQK